jgi:hypothetical protein
MILLTPDVRFALRANDIARRAADRDGKTAPDPVPVIKLFNPLGAATWIATELYDDGDTLFGLADLGFGCPELGTFSLSEMAGVRLPFGLGIERDLSFATIHRLRHGPNGRAAPVRSCGPKPFSAAPPKAVTAPSFRPRPMMGVADDARRVTPQM